MNLVMREILFGFVSISLITPNNLLNLLRRNDFRRLHANVDLADADPRMIGFGLFGPTRLRAADAQEHRADHNNSEWVVLDVEKI